MNMTQPNGRSGTFRVPEQRAGELRVINGAVFGDIVDRLGSFESLNTEPEQLKKIVAWYEQNKAYQEI